MSATREKLESQAAKLRKQLAEAQAVVDGLQMKLAKVEEKLGGPRTVPAPQCGLDILWSTALPIARTRSSKQQCRIEWNKIPKAQRPQVREMIEALKFWNRCEEWRKDGNAFVPALHRWIKNRQWENVPESAKHDPLSRYRSRPKPVPVTPPGEEASAEDIAHILGGLTRKVSANGKDQA